MNTSSESASYALVSETGAALLIDYGYDMTTWTPLGGPRWTQRPLLASLPALRRQHGVTRVEVMMPTHYHDDHCAGANLLRDVEGTQIWVPESITPVLGQPSHYDLPCLWFDPVPADRVLPLGEPVRWHEYTITPHPLPGHTPFSAAYEVEVDGVRVLAVGDQQDGLGGPGTGRDMLNYQYRNRFDYDDYRASAALYRRIAPELMIAGHWAPRRTDADFFARLTAEAERMVELHQALLPLDELHLPPDGVLARMFPYYQAAEPGAVLTYGVELHNAVRAPARVVVRPVMPDGWRAEPGQCTVDLGDGGDAIVGFSVRVPADCPPGRRILAIDVDLGDLPLGQHAEAVVEVAGQGRG